MDVLFEHNVSQNIGLAAETLWTATAEAYAASGKISGIPLPLSMIILPLAFHQRSAELLASKTQPAAMYKALAADGGIVIGLQRRMESMAANTFAGIDLAIRSGLIEIDREQQCQLFPKRKTAPVDHYADDVRIILAAAKRIGQAITEMSPTQLSSQLKIQF